MTAEQFAKLQRDFLIRAEKRSAVLLDAEFARLKREITDFLIQTTGNRTVPVNLYVADYLERILLLLENKLDVIGLSAARIVSRTQTNVINFASGELKKYLKLKIESSIFSPDREAIRGLIGRAFEGKSLQTVFKRMKQPVADRARIELIEGFALGESNAQIAKRISDVTDLGRYRALTISRTEQNMAFKSATLDFYREAEIDKWVWVSSLDNRVCITCLFLHGKIFKTNKKVFSHPNDRCTLVPLLPNQKPIKTGVEIFNSLEKGVQKELIGNKRFELFENGTHKLSDFVGKKQSDEFGEIHFIKPIADLTQ